MRVFAWVYEYLPEDMRLAVLNGVCVCARIYCSFCGLPAVGVCSCVSARCLCTFFLFFFTFSFCPPTAD